MRCKELLEAKVLVVDLSGEGTELSAKVYYHRAGRCRARYSHLDVLIPSSCRYADLLQKGFYEASVSSNKLVIDLSRLVVGYKLVIELKDRVFSGCAKYLARVRRSLEGSNIKVVVRLPKNVELLRGGT